MFTKTVCALNVGRNSIVLDLGKKVYKTHIDKYSTQYNQTVGIVVSNKNNPSLWGIKLAMQNDVVIKDVQDNEKTVSANGVIPIIKNLKIKFDENTKGEIL